MNQKLTRSVLFLVSALMASSAIVSCGDAAEAPVVTDAAPVTEAVTTEALPEITSGVPSDVRFDGQTVTVLNSARYDSERAMLNVTETNGDLLNDEIYARNRDVAEKLGITIQYEDYDFDATGLISKTVMAGDDTYDAFSSLAVYMLSSVTKNLFLDLADAPYIDINQPWWATDYINNLSVSGDHRFFLSGDITTLFLRWLPCVYFNKKLYNEFYEESSELYQMVLDGKWTLDVVNNITKDVYRDLNGNNKKDKEDMLGSGVVWACIADSLYMSAGGRYSSIDADGRMVIDAITEHNMSIFEKFYYLYYENPSTLEFDCTWEAINGDMTNKFKSDEMLLDYGWFYTSDYLRDMKSDYGILPMPKADESTPAYRSIIYVDTDVFCVPKTCSKPETVCAFMEDMAFIGYQKLSPAYFDVVLKGKYLRDESSQASMMLDIIHDGAFTDPAYAYSNAISIGTMHRTLIQAKSKDWASTYEKKKKTYDKELTKLYEAFEAIEE